MWYGGGLMSKFSIIISMIGMLMLGITTTMCAAVPNKFNGDVKSLSILQVGGPLPGINKFKDVLLNKFKQKH